MSLKIDKQIKISRPTEFEITYRVNPTVSNDELNALFADPLQNQEIIDFRLILERSLAFICAYQSVRLIGFVNLAWDGGVHAFILDPTVHPEFRRRGIGKMLVKKAVETAKQRGIEWLHVDFEPYLQDFYDKCGFKNTRAGIMNLNSRD
jgi:ribosomal protein S18 acetylase RimI-like enzyme